MARLNEIIVPHGSVRALAKDTGFSEITVRHALKGVTSSPNAYMIRKRAMDFYRGSKQSR